MRFAIGTEDAEGMHRASRAELAEQIPQAVTPYSRVSDVLKREGLIDDCATTDAAPFDVTANLFEYPAPCSARLQALSRADTGFLGGVAYSALRGFGQMHPAVGELRNGYLELCVPYPFDDAQCICIGEILITEVECFSEADDNRQLKLAVGYGAVFGRNENKAISMAVVDRELELNGPYSAQNEEFVLTHGDSLEMNGFISHLKLSHYVTFQSKLNAVRKTRTMFGRFCACRALWCSGRNAMAGRQMRTMWTRCMLNLSQP